MNRIGFDPRLPTVSFSEQYLRQLNAKLTEIFRSIAASINAGSDGILFTSTVVTGNYTLQPFEQIAIVKNTANCTVTLPDPSDCVNKRFTVKKANSNVYTVTVVATSGNIDDATSQIITTGYTSLDFVSDGTDYWII